MAKFADNLKKLPGISHLAAINLLDADGDVLTSIENKAGSQGSLAVYNHLAQTYGAITPDAARKGLEIFAFVVINELKSLRISTIKTRELYF